jgi:hypothetical protein
MSKRHYRPIVVTWIATLLGVLLWWWSMRQFGVFGDLLKPALPLILAPALWKSWRWFHARHGDDRRDHERRHDKTREGS